MWPVWYFFKIQRLCFILLPVTIAFVLEKNVYFLIIGCVLNMFNKSSLLVVLFEFSIAIVAGFYCLFPWLGFSLCLRKMCWTLPGPQLMMVISQFLPAVLATFAWYTLKYIHFRIAVIWNFFFCIFAFKFSIVQMF